MVRLLLSPYRVLWTYRDRLIAAVGHDVRQRFAGSLLGSIWVVLNPMLLMTLYTVIYVAILKVRPASLDTWGYVILVLSGLVPILMFNESLIVGTGAVASQRNLLLNTVFPAELMPARAILAAQPSGLISILLVAFASLASGRARIDVLLWLPALWVSMMMFVLGIVWILSLISLVFRDIQQALGVIAMTLMILSPAAYTPEMVPDALRLVLYLNPLSYFVLWSQDVVCYGRSPSLMTVGVAMLLSLVSFVCGFHFFLKTKFVFVDHA
jgi:lipopolysaccharide transport system permease protein